MAKQINVNEFKPGVTFLYNNDVFMVIDSSHSKSGRGQAHVKCKVKNLIKKTTTSLTFSGGEKVESAFVERKKMQYLYIDGDNAFFMDSETFEQIEIPRRNLIDELKYITNGLEVLVMNYESKILGVEISKNVELTVVESANAVKGDTVTNATKKAVLETGIEVDVPQFIDKGQKIIINTITGKYVGKI